MVVIALKSNVVAWSVGLFVKCIYFDYYDSGCIVRAYSACVRHLRLFPETVRCHVVKKDSNET